MANDPGHREAENRPSRNPLHGWIFPLFIGFMLGLFELLIASRLYGHSLSGIGWGIYWDTFLTGVLCAAIYLPLGFVFAITPRGAGTRLQLWAATLATAALITVNHSSEVSALKQWLPDPNMRMLIPTASVVAILLAAGWVARKLKVSLLGFLIKSLPITFLVTQFFTLGFSTSVSKEKGVIYTKPNIVLIVIDTLRADHVSAYGHSVDGLPTSPRLDSVARQGVRYAQAYAQAPWTRPSVASLMTGLLPQSHGVATPFDRLPESLDTLAEYLQRNGYHTSAFSANPQVSTDFGFDKGFDHFWSINNSLDSYLTSNRVGRKLDAVARELQAKLSGADHPNIHRGIPDADADRINHEFKRWALEQHFDKPRFHYLHYLDPHDPYTAPEDLIKMRGESSSKPRKKDLAPHPAEEFLLAPMDLPPFPVHGYEQTPLEESERQDLMRRYDEEIRFADHRIGKLLGWMGKQGIYNSGTDLLIITSDHGEEFYEHQQWLHGRSLFDEMVNVPLLIQGHWLPEGLVVEEPVQLIDILPTIAAYLNTPLNFDVHGRPLPGFRLPEWAAPPNDFGPDPGPDFGTRTDHPIYSHRPRADHPIDMVRLGKYKLIAVEDGSETHWMLFDVEEDPTEQRNLWGEYEELQESLIHQMRAFQAQAIAARPPGESRTELNQRLEEQLRALGYLDKK